MIGSSAAFSDFFGGICQESGLCLPPSKVCACDLNFKTRTDPPPLILAPFLPPYCPIEPLPCPILPLFSVAVSGHEVARGGTYSVPGFSHQQQQHTQHPETSPTKETCKQRREGGEQLAPTFQHRIPLTVIHQRKNLLVAGTVESHKRAIWFWPAWQGTQRGY